MPDYFSDQEIGVPPARDLEEITKEAWGGIATLINTGIAIGSFANSFPEPCRDGERRGVIGTDSAGFIAGLKAEVPEISDYLGRLFYLPDEDPPETEVALDLVQFCHWRVAKATVRNHHEFLDHDHLQFNIEEGQSEFLDRVNQIFERNGIAFKLLADSRIQRLVPKELHDLVSSSFDTGDEDLDALLEEAILKFQSPKTKVQEDAVRKLWDAWERLKSQRQLDKKASTRELLDDASQGNLDFRRLLEKEAKALTDIGNGFRIRHHEKGQIRLEEPDQLEYVFYRLLNLIRYLNTFAAG